MATMTEQDLYSILGVPRSADEKQIRKAYRDLARKYHPDRNPDDPSAEDRFKEASFAREVLLNSEKRKLYDEFGLIGLKEGFEPDAYRRYASGGGFGGAPGGFAEAVNLEDLFRERGGNGGGFQDLFGSDVIDALFGRGGRSRRPAARRGRDVSSSITIDFAEAVRGAEKDLTIKTPGVAERSIKVRVPAGVRDGGRIRLRGQGQDGGDLVLEVSVRAHPHFRREGDDLLLDLPVTIGEAMDGARVPVPTPAGEVTLRIPPGIKGGGKLRLRGQGVKRGNKTGDLIVQVHIQLPDDPGEQARDAARELEQAYGEGLRKDLKL